MILAISGSLRGQSLNGAALRAAAGAAGRAGIAVALDDSVRALPHFDPDLEADPPDAVRRFRAACAGAGAVLLAVPEYAFGIPGTFKNALDWTVGGGSLYRKPVAVLSVAAAGRGNDVRRALERVLTALDCDATFHSMPVRSADLDDDGELRDRELTAGLLRVVDELAARARRHSGGAEATLSARGHT